VFGFQAALERKINLIGKLATCTRCGRMIYLAEEVGLRWTADMEPLDAQTAVQALVGGREVYRVTQPGPSLQTAKPDVLKALREAPVGDRPTVVGSHPCPAGAAKALTPVLPASEGEGGTGAPKGPAGPSEPRTAPSSGPATERSGAPNAETRRSDTLRGAPKCDGCGQPCADGTYASIALGDLIQWAHHVTACGA
jgi:hypothetical protein